ncbi:MAG: DUF2135 domain-containing protein, partial [Ferruginibacter sp.]
CINSAASADYSNLKYVALKTGGELIDLQKDGIAVSIKKLTIIPLRFMGIQQNSQVEENFPSMQVTVGNSFSASGIATPALQEIVLQFGYGNKITLTKKITIQPDKQLCENFDITKVFAQKKIAELDIQYEENRQAIESLGKRFGIITRNTSLIVLETINDYLQYDIEPPAELRIEYDRVMKQRSLEITLQKEDHLKTSREMMGALKSWWQATKKTPPIVNTPIITSEPNTVPVVHANQGRTGLTPHPAGAAKSITGSVTAARDRSSVAGVSVRIKGLSAGTQSDATGKYTLMAKQGDVLQYAGVGFNTIERRVGSNLTVNVVLQTTQNHLEEVVVVGYGSQRKADLTGSVVSISTDNINPSIVVSTERRLQGKTAGVQVTNNNGTPGAMGNVRIRGNSTSTNSSSPLYVIDGRAGNQTDVNADDIESINVLQGSNATAIYGAIASNGAVIITTKNRTGGITDSLLRKNNDIKNRSGGAINLPFNNETTEYIKILKATDKAGRYEKYLELRKYNMANPVFFFEVASLILKTADKETGLKILSNLAELETGSYELYKMLGYKLKETGDYDSEVIAFKKVIELRSLDPQSFRDYALALEDAGRYQEALDQLYEGMTKSYGAEMRGIYEGIEEIFLVEINRLIAIQSKKLRLEKIPASIIKSMPVDLRVVMNWNMNNTDIDLWVTDPNGERCFYSHSSTEMGGRISNDFTDGFGPEQFMLKNAEKGKYRIEINYYGDRQVTLAGPTTIMAEIYLHYGMPNEEKRTITLQMEKGKSGAVFIGEVSL